MHRVKRFDTMLPLRLASRTRTRMQALAARLPLSESALAREAMAIGLDRIERDPAALLRRRGRGA